MAQLCQQQEELGRRRIQVLIISFSAPEFARAWLEETGAPFILLLDPERAVYGLYGLERSAVRAWSLRTILYYLRNWTARPSREARQDDFSQLGGDFIVDSHGILRMVYRSHDPVDRPSVKELFSLFDRLEPL